MSFQNYFRKSVEAQQAGLQEAVVEAIFEKSHVPPEEVELDWDVVPDLVSWDQSSSTGVARARLGWDAVAGGCWRDDLPDISINGRVTATFRVTHPGGSDWLQFELEGAVVENDL